MADLPSIRLEETPPFTYIGIDLFGPLSTAEGVNTRRTNSTKKSWGVVFMCLVTRAIHLELVQGLDYVSFRNSFRRFISLRGIPRTIYSDNGTNMMAFKNELEVFRSLSTLKSEDQCFVIDWRTTPPNASHFGGS